MLWFDPSGLVKSALGSVASFLSGLGKRIVAKKLARHRAMSGDELALKGGLARLIEVELQELSKSWQLRPEFRNEAFRRWLLGAGAEAFLDVLLARAGDLRELEAKAVESLALRFERETGETRALAQGPISLVVSDLYGQLTATDEGAKALQTALAFRTAARVEGMARDAQTPFPSPADIARVRALASKLVDVGRAAWTMPAFVAPLTLEVLVEKKEDGEGQPLPLQQLVDAVDAGESVVLYGDGGIGKTTLLLQLPSLLADRGSRRILLFVDAAAWARSGQGVLDFIAATPAAELGAITAHDLARLSATGTLTLLVNGWNEIPAQRKWDAREAFNQLTSAIPSLSVVMTSRTVHDTASLAAARRIAVRGLTWKGQSSVIRSELEPDAAERLLETLARDTPLRHAARSPLILRGLVAQARVDQDLFARSVFDLLGAVVASVEADPKRREILDEGPVLAQHSRYLQAIACEMNHLATTSLTRDEALAAVGAAAAELVERHLLGTPPQPASVLDVLTSHHVLHRLADGTVRFAHQRFQEYFAAARLLLEVNRLEEPSRLLRTATNEPAWADSLQLLAGKLRGAAGGNDGGSGARARLVRSAYGLDVSYACDLAGLSGFSESDDPELHRALVASVTALHDSPLVQVNELAIACMIASRQPAFAGYLWSLFESDSQQSRLHSYRLDGSRVSLAQLGPEAEARLRTWPSERRSEFIHEVAENSENYDFIVGLAMTDPEVDVRTAAMSALFWHYPASMAGINAWLAAPLEVQAHGNFINSIEYALEEDFASDVIRAQLKRLSECAMPDDTRVRLAISFPDEVGGTAVEAVLARLKSEENRGRPDALIDIAKKHASERLKALAVELAAVPGTPEWVDQLLLADASDDKEAAFEAAWTALQDGRVKRVRQEVIGPLSSPAQTRRSVEFWLSDWKQRYGEMSEDDQERGRQVQYLLAHAPGGHLVDIVFERAPQASYDEGAKLAELLMLRLPGEYGESHASPWKPTREQFVRIFDLLSSMTEPAPAMQDTLFAKLACIASHVAAADFGPLILEAFKRQLDAWSAFQLAVDAWSKGGGGERPMNPQMGNYLLSALARWGIDALPGVLEFRDHPCAMKSLPEAVRRLVNIPKPEQRGFGTNGLMTAIVEGRQRRRAGMVLRQESAEHQPVTDEAADVIAGFLLGEVERALAERAVNPKWNPKIGMYYLRGLASVLANIPSPRAEEVVVKALRTGLLDVYGIDAALTGLVRQGWVLSDEGVAKELEAVYERETAPKWVEQGMRYTLQQLNQMMFLVEPPSLLAQPLSHYLASWRHWAGDGNVIRLLGQMEPAHAWPMLMALGAEFDASGTVPEELAYSVASALTRENFDEFCHLVSDGRFFRWCKTSWTIDRTAPSVVAISRNNEDLVAMLVDACRKSASPEADALLGEVLVGLGGREELLMRSSLDALDKGRAGDRNAPAYRNLRRMFRLKVPLSENQYEVQARSCNVLRRELYRRAKQSDALSVAARRILASLERSRREGDRPQDEPRHPEPDGLAWTDVLTLAGGEVT